MFKIGYLKFEYKRELPKNSGPIKSGPLIVSLLLKGLYSLIFHCHMTVAAGTPRAYILWSSYADHALIDRFFKINISTFYTVVCKMI